MQDLEENQKLAVKFEFDFLCRSRRSSRDDIRDFEQQPRSRRLSRDETDIRMRRSSREELGTRSRRTSRDEGSHHHYQNGSMASSRERRSSSVKEGRIHVSHRDLSSKGSNGSDQGHSQGQFTSNGMAAAHDRWESSSQPSCARSQEFQDGGSRSHDHRHRDYHRSRSSQEIRSRQQGSFSRENRQRDSVRSHGSTRSYESSRTRYSDRSRDRDPADILRHQERDHFSERELREQDWERNHKHHHHHR